MAQFNWAYVDGNVISGSGGPDGAVQYRTGTRTISGSSRFTFATSSNTLEVTGTVNISGALNVAGTTTTISASNLVIRDPIIGLGFGSGSTLTGAVGDRGLIFGLAGNLNQAILWDQTSASFVVGKVGTQGPHGTAYNIPGGDFSAFKVGSLKFIDNISGSGGVTIEGESILKGALNVTGATTVKGDLSVTNASAISASGPMTIEGESILKGALAVSGACTFDTITVAGTSGGEGAIFEQGLTIKNADASAGFINFYEQSSNGTNVCTFRGKSSMGNITITLPGDTGTVVLEDNTVTLSNKTLTSPTITGADLGATVISASGPMTIEGETILKGALNVTGTVSVAQKIEHGGDDDTYIEFTADSMAVNVGGEEMILALEGGGGIQADKVTINNGSEDIDFQVKGSGANVRNLIRTDAANDRVGIGHGAGALSGSGVLTVIGAISGSSALTIEGESIIKGALNVTGAIESAGIITGNQVTGSNITALVGLISANTITGSGVLTAGRVNTQLLSGSNLNINESKAVITTAGIISGSTISGALFVGGGSGLTGITSTWDGQLNGNASITGSLTVTTTITGSGALTVGQVNTQLLSGSNLNLFGGKALISTAGHISSSGPMTIEGESIIKGALNVTGAATMNGGAVFNDGGVDVDFRIESVDESHIIFVEGSSNRVSIGDNTGSPGATLEVKNHASAGAYNVPLVQLNSNDTDQIALDINAANVDANVVDILANDVTTAKVINVSADGLTTGNAFYVDDNSSDTGTRNTALIIQNNAAATASTALAVQSDGGITGVTLDKNYSDTILDATVTGIQIDFDKTGASTTDNTIYGLQIDMDNTTATNGNNTMYGLHVTPTLTHAANAGVPVVYGALFNAQGGTNGTSIVQAARFEAGGGDLNYGLQLDVEDGGVDLRIESSADSGDYFQIQTTTHGATTITTVDDNATAADLTFNIDGDITLDPVGGNVAIDGHISSSGPMTIEGESILKGALNVTGAATVKGGLAITNASAISASGPMTIEMESILKGALNVTGAIESAGIITGNQVTGSNITALTSLISNNIITGSGIITGNQVTGSNITALVGLISANTITGSGVLTAGQVNTQLLSGSNLSLFGGKALISTAGNLTAVSGTFSGDLICTGTLTLSGSDTTELLRLRKGPDQTREIVFENDGADAASIYLNNGENLFITNTTVGNNISLKCGANQILSIVGNGTKVGINNTSPDSALDVSASLGSTTAAIIEGDVMISGSISAVPNASFIIASQVFS